MKHLSAKTLLLSAIIFASSFGMMSDANPNSTIKSFANLEFLQAGDAFNEKVRDISEIEPSEPEKANRLRKIVALIVTKEAFEETMNPFAKTRKLKTKLCKDDNDCKNTKFGDQPVVQYSSTTMAVRCTGVLVAPNIIATAAHCLIPQGTKYPRIKDLRFIFGYRWSANFEESSTIQAKNIYQGKPVDLPKPKIEGIAKTIGYKYCQNSDWVLIWLKTDKVKVDDEEVKAAGISAFNEVGGNVYMAGHPYGLPLKVTNEGHVLDLSPDDIVTPSCRQTQPKIVSDLPGVEVFSGAPVFNNNTVIGIHQNHETATAQASPSVNFADCLTHFKKKKKASCEIKVCQIC